MDDIAITRIMPNSLEAEQSVIGSMLMTSRRLSVQAKSFRQTTFITDSMELCSRPWLI